LTLLTRLLSLFDYDNLLLRYQLAMTKSHNEDFVLARFPSDWSSGRAWPPGRAEIRPTNN
jgi:hypothetical protein